MKAEQFMTPDPLMCTPDTSAARAAELMLEADCGILPVMSNGKLTGVVTDRDLFIALATRGKSAAALRVGEVAQSPVYTCSPDDDIHSVLETMREHRVRRVPVEGFGGTVLGMISINDILLAIGPKSVGGAEVVEALQTICAHHHPTPHIVGAVA